MADGILDITPLHPRLGQEAMLHSELMLSADTVVALTKKGKIIEL